MNIELSPKASEIVSHARVLLETGGYKSFSYADISTLVNIRKASVHHHFASKAELVRVVVALYRQEALQGMQMIDRQPLNSQAKLQAYVNYWSDCIREGKASFCICAMLAFEMASLPVEVAREVRSHFEDLTTWLTKLLEQGKEQGELHFAGSPETEATALMANVHGAMLAARVTDNPAIFSSLMQLSINKLI